MGIGKMLKDPPFCFYLEKLDDNKTKLINKSYYQSVTLMIKIMNRIIKIMNSIMMKRKMGQIQEQILGNIKKLAES
jgi:hypothetical protein